MRAVLNGNSIQLEAIALDDFGWDHADTHGDHVLTLYLTKNELLEVGKALWNYAEECLADEPDFFEGEFRKDIPVPQSETVFVEQPERLGTYLNDSFWSREAIVAVLDAAHAPGTSAQHSFWIQDFKRANLQGDDIGLEFSGVEKTKTNIGAIGNKPS